MRRITTIAWFRLLFAASLLVPAGYFASSAWESRQRTLQEADRQIVTTVRLLSEQTEKVLLADRLALDDVNQLIRGMSWDDIRQSAELHRRLQKLQARLPQVDLIFLVAPDGSLAANSMASGLPPYSVPGRDYFLALRDRPGTDIYPGTDMSIGGTHPGRTDPMVPYFNVVERRSTPDGGFDGLIVLSIRPQYLNDFYQSFLGPDGLSIMLVRTDGAVLARYPADGPTRLGPGSRLLAGARSGESGLYHVPASRSDDIRLGGFARVANSDVIVAYGLLRNGVLASWWRDLVYYGVLTAIGSICLAMMTWLAMTNSLQIVAARAHLETVNETLAQEMAERLRIEANLMALNRDLEQRVAARTGSLEELAAQRERETAFLVAVIQATPYAKLVVDQQGTIIMVNTAAEVLFGYSRDELTGQRLERLIASGARAEHAALREDLMGSPAARAMGPAPDLVAVRKDGTEVPVEIALSPLETPSGPAVIAGIVDVSARQQNEVALRRANNDLRSTNSELRQANAIIQHKSEEVEAFVYIVSHDLRTPLINLQGFSRELELGCAALRAAVDAIGLPEEMLHRLHTLIDDDIDGTLHYIRDSVTRFERLINALLELSRTGQYTMQTEPLDMGSIVAATLQDLNQTIVAATAGIEVNELPDAVGDSVAVSRIFVNLIENAIKYAHPMRAPCIGIGGDLTGGMAHYWICDNGVGIPNSARPRLFQVFQRFHPGLADGDGIGLASVRRLVERHGGAVWADSASDVGTTFHFTLPARI